MKSVGVKRKQTLLALDDSTAMGDPLLSALKDCMVKMSDLDRTVEKLSRRTKYLENVSRSAIVDDGTPLSDGVCVDKEIRLVPGLGFMFYLSRYIYIYVFM